MSRCNHWTLCKQRIDDLLKLLEDQDVVVLNDKNRGLLQEALRLYIESQEDCAVCYDVPTDPVITNCKHVFCRPCIIKAIQIQHKCPMCRNPLTEDCLLEPAPEDADDDNFDAEVQSSKTEAMMQIVRATVKNPGSKIVIFSQWTSFLNIIQNQMKLSNIQYTRIDGTMNADKRDRAIHALDNDPDTRVMLASLAVCSVGLNLVSADTVILSDSCKSIPNPVQYPQIRVLMLLAINRVGARHRGPSHRQSPSPGPNAGDNRVAPRHGEHGRGARAGHPGREARACQQGVPGQRRQREEG